MPPRAANLIGNIAGPTTRCGQAASVHPTSFRELGKRRMGFVRVVALVTVGKAIRLTRSRLPEPGYGDRVSCRDRCHRACPVDASGLLPSTTATTLAGATAHALTHSHSNKCVHEGCDSE